MGGDELAMGPFWQLIIPTTISAGGPGGWGSRLVAKVRSDPAGCRARGGSQAVTLLEDPQFPAQLFDPVSKESQAGRDRGGGGGIPVKSTLFCWVGKVRRRDPDLVSRAGEGTHLGVRHGRGWGQLGTSRRALKWGGTLSGPGGAGALSGAGPEPPESGG